MQQRLVNKSFSRPTNCHWRSPHVHMAAAFQVFRKVQSSKLNTKVCTVQVHLRKEPTRDWGVWLTCWSMHFISENIIVVAHFKSTRKNWQFTIWHLLLKEEGCSRITRCCCTSPCTSHDTSHRLPLPKVLIHSTSTCATLTNKSGSRMSL